jgi:lipoprotein signal peptidase
MTMNLGINTSKIQGSKKAVLSISLILMLAMTLMMAFAQPTSAQLGILLSQRKL